MNDNPYRALPSVADLADSAHDVALLGPTFLTSLAQAHLTSERLAIASGQIRTRGEIVNAFRAGLAALVRPRLEAVLNATGVVIHTNLGRSPVSEATAEAMREAASGYVSLELEPETNARGGRMREISDLMRMLTGAEATLVVNNNAAAILLVLSALAAGKGAVVSRGEAVEIGGGFRIPDVMRQSGARLIEVGTTNRTYAADYERAIDADTAVLLKVHPSNFTIDGFTATADIPELAEISRRHRVAVVEDLGSGALIDTQRYGLAREPTIGERIAAGANVITASGDKLLGGPQAGLIAGDAELVERIARHPLARAVRADKTCLAGIAQTLRHYAAGMAETAIPVWRMISTTEANLAARARSIELKLGQVSGAATEVVRTSSTVGGGSLPGQRQPSAAISIVPAPGRMSVDDLARRLRMGTPRVFGRVDDGRLLLDLRAVLPEHDEQLTGTAREALQA